MKSGNIQRGLIKACAATALTLSFCAAAPADSAAQGKWIPVTTGAPDYNHGVLLLLTDGRVMAKTSYGKDTYGSGWDILTPDIHGSYVNGTWSKASNMADSRLYYSSQVLRNGKVYVAGGEYGSGRTVGETYDPINDFWMPVSKGLPVTTDTISDANSEMLPDGKVMQAIVKSKTALSKNIYIYDPETDAYTAGPPIAGNANESVWLKFPDNSFMFVDIFSTVTERYIPSLNKWKTDAPVPVNLYDPYGFETGAAFMLPDGRAFFIGSDGNTAYYTPSGDTSNGTWAAGPDIPDTMGAPDAAAAMMVNGKILCSFSHVPTLDSVFHKPMYFYEFDYKTEKFTRLPTPDGQDSVHVAAYLSNMVCLPDGSILYGQQGDDSYYVYQPDGKPLAEGKPTLSTVSMMTGRCDSFVATGMLFNGITEGASYGDDWQMNTNYPIIRFISSTGDTVVYATTYNWNSTGIMRGKQLDTAIFVLPLTFPTEGTYSVQVVVNGNPSDPIPFDVCTKLAVNNKVVTAGPLTVYPNPAEDETTVAFTSARSGGYTIKIQDLYGRTVRSVNGYATEGKNTVALQLKGVAKGVYTVSVRTQDGVSNTSVVVR